MKLSLINFNMKMTPSKPLTPVFYDHLSYLFTGISIQTINHGTQYCVH